MTTLLLIDGVFNRIAENIVPIAVTAIITILATYFANRKIQKRLASADKKEREQAIDDIADTIEKTIVDNREKLSNTSDYDDIGLSKRRIEHRIQAAEREYKTNLSSITPKYILQDVDWTISRSRHLDQEQINTYSEIIGSIIDDIEKEAENEVSVPVETEDAIRKIEDNAEYDGVEGDINQLKQSLDESGRQPADLKYVSRITSTTIGIMVAVIMSISFLFIESSIGQADLPTDLLTILIPVMVLFFIVMALIENISNLAIEEESDSSEEKDIELADDS